MYSKLAAIFQTAALEWNGSKHALKCNRLGLIAQRKKQHNPTYVVKVKTKLQNIQTAQCLKNWKLITTLTVLIYMILLELFHWFKWFKDAVKKTQHSLNTLKPENNKLFMFVYQTSEHIPTHTFSNNIRKYATKYPYMDRVHIRGLHYWKNFLLTLHHRLAQSSIALHAYIPVVSETWGS